MVCDKGGKMKQRIAVLGSGPGALGAVWEITQSPKWQDRFEIDVYVMGWRLGGKTASGRDPANRFRNEEHGLHILGGFYHNCFQQLMPLYDEWNRDATNCPIPYDEAFFKQGSFSLMQREASGTFREVRYTIGGDDRKPGVDAEDVNPKTVVRAFLRWAGMGFLAMSDGMQPEAWAVVQVASLDAEQQYESKRQMTAFDAQAAHEMASIGSELVNAAEQPDSWSDATETDPETDLIMNAAQRAINWIVEKDDHATLIENADWLGMAGLALVICKGLRRDRVFDLGFDSINQFDAKEWLSRHGATDQILRNGAYQAGYNYAFAFTDGDPNKRDFAAGTALRAYFKLLFASHGSIFYHLNGGMGEIYALPFYDVLKARGVRFHFFHKVTGLYPDNEGSLQHIDFQIQAKAKNGDYEPVISYRPDEISPPRRCWPSQPLWDQLESRADASDTALDFESFYGPVPSGSVDKQLRAGEDFDLCILAIPVGMLRIIAKPLAAASNEWRDMLASAGTSPTIAAQSWRRLPVTHFGGFSTKELMTSYELPLDTWADMSFLLKYEQTDNENRRPDSLSYFCGAVPKPAGSSTVTLPAEERSRAPRLTETWMKANLANAFPGLRSPNDGYDKESEIERISIINSDPAKLYVTAPKNSIKHRLRPTESGFANLFLAGDWTRHNFDCGAVESAVVSARLCARGICGYPKIIYGETDFA
jgi:uncharacterized protein with NAD-binding domain and iron-sulfur cluster